MSRSNVFSILCYALAVSFGYVSAAPRCGDSLIFRPNSTYDINRRLVLSTLASNVSSRDGYYNVSVGEGPGRIYVLGLCIPGADRFPAQSASVNASWLPWLCGKLPLLWVGRGLPLLSCLRPTHNNLNSWAKLGTMAMNTTRFGTDLDTVLFLHVVDCFGTGDCLYLNKTHYLADMSPLIGSERIYALMQCIPGLSSKQCEICVRDSLRDYQNCCNGFMGGTIRKPVCYFLWDGYAYFGAFNDTPSAPTQESQPGPILSPPTPPPLTTGAIVGIVVSTVIFVVLVILGLFIWKKKQSYKTLKPQNVTAADDDMTSPQSLQFDFGTIEAATDGFSRNNKLGQGGFGEVYKGTLLDGTEVAVKRLLRNSGQGTQEFKNEVVIVAKLQHKNLVRLLGFCVEGDEQILVYEFVPNQSLYYFLFNNKQERYILFIKFFFFLKSSSNVDPTKKSQLDWKSRYNIIGGITRGLLYLHQDSRLTIIHRDIKASNILLDEHINPKIADFGMARNFRVDQTEDMTGRVVGTFSYMPPEYVTHGQYSTKSDVYSFGVLVLEIVCGKKNSSFYQVDDSGGNLVTHAWRLWNNESPLDTIDPAIGESYEKDEVIRCIHIGLFSFQDLQCKTATSRQSKVSLICGFVSAQQRCGDSLFFRPNSTYDTNRRLVLSTLASNVSSRDGYYNVSVGEGPGRIYVLGLCIPGADPTACSDCIQPASVTLLDKCPNQTNSWNWRADKTLCFVRYSNRWFFNQIDLEPNQAEFLNLDITGDLAEYNRTWEGLMSRVISAASSTTPGSLAGRHYAASTAPLSGFRTIYALMQCIPGISSVDCNACLQANVRSYQGCCWGKQGGSIRRPVCFFRFDPYPYLEAFDDIASSPPPQISQDLQPTTSPPHPPPDGKAISTGVIVVIVVSAVIFVALVALVLVVLKRRQSYKTLKLETDDDITRPHSLQIDFKTIEAATNKFSRSNKVGQGGFGEVYKGKLPNGAEVAVKRLSRNSGQGTQEFRNEVVVLAKLQHRNLVRLLGFCVEGDEQILVYEFVPNKSLDYFLFDPIKRRQLDWTRRYNVIRGVARGILYLHQDSRLTIIHRDLKASNILLDNDMNPKIADFGMARIFGMEQTRANTSKIAGTFGYMAPEYAMHGRFSMKSDVYSFGVLVLEIISGKINSSFNQTDGSASNLVTHAWRLWRKGSALELVDSSYRDSYQRNEVTRCIHIALLCVQEDPGDRPTMSKIILLLTSSTVTLQVPHAPGFFFRSSRDQDLEAEGSDSFGKPIACSINDASVTELDPR
uniref:Uncharacterized protein n=1 Tax=Brassica oleracea TaxID=3712 RepID=A0A3P6DTM6_BRAOL|nr:unnamed protein product [Brassica oleracea]